ncbi:MAG TPA: ABC transporter permease [Longimicrobiales bacterium]
MDTLLQDVRFAFRTLVKSPGFAAAAVLTLALGIGANTAIFSLVHGVVMRPLPYPEADEMTTVWMSNPRQGIDRDVTSYPNFVDWREQSRSFDVMVGIARSVMNLTGDGEPEELPAALVSDGYFRLLGVEPVLGRGFLPEEATPGGEPVVVLSHDLWTSRFGRDPGVIGRSVRLNGSPYRIIGVMPPGAGWPTEAKLWVPLAMRGSLASLAERRGALWLSVFGRLADGVTLAGAQAEMDAIARRLEEAYPDANEGIGIVLEPMHETVVGDVRPALMVLLGAVGCVLLIACANVSGLLLARGRARRQEVAVRVALGAGRARLARQALTESVVLAAIGGGIALLVATWAVDLLVRLAPARVPRLDGVGIDGVALAFAAGTTVLAALLFGVAPALDVARRDPGALLKEGGRGRTGGAGDRVRPAFVAGQFALALVLLAGAGLMVRSLVRLQEVDPGFEPRGVLAVGINLPGRSYPDGAAVRGFYDRLLPAVAAMPGVESVDAISTLFLGRLPRMTSVTVRDVELPDAVRRLPVPYDAVTPGVFRTLRMELRQGRELAATDGPDAPNVAVVNEAFVRRYFPGGKAVGRQFALGGAPERDEDWITIVGIVEDARRGGLDREPRPQVFLPHAQFPTSRMTVLVRARGDVLAQVGAVRAAVRRIDPDQPISDVRTLERNLSGSVASRRFLMFLLLVFAAASTLLAAVGIYGIMAQMVVQRTREIGVRVALGARSADIVRMVVRRGMALAGAGLGLGVLAALALGRLLSGMLFGVQPSDPLTLLVVSGVLAAVGALACYLPTRRATRVDPQVALRAE